MNKTEFLSHLLPELRRIEEEKHITELLNSKCYEQADVIASEVDNKCLREFYRSSEFEEIADSDIPMEYKIAWGVYLRKSGYDESEIMGDECHNWIDSLRYTGVPAGILMAKVVSKYCINLYANFEKFMEAV